MTRKLLALVGAATMLLAARLSAQDLPTGLHQPSADDPFCASAGAGAQSCDITMPVHLSISHLVELYTPDVSTEFGDIGWGRYVPGPTLYAWSNTDWSVSVKAATANFTGPGAKSASTLYVYVPSPFSLNSVASPVTLQTGSMGGFTALNAFNLYTYVNPSTDAPGDYSIDLVYTITGS